MQYRGSEYNAPSFELMQKAAGGDPDAINAFVDHYKKYITRLSTRRCVDEEGLPYYFVDEDMRRNLETRLIVEILNQAGQFDT